MSQEKRNWVYGGLQQVGIGVRDNSETLDFYARHLKFDVTMFNEIGTADIMSPYMGNKTWRRHARFILNLRGGGGIEIWQYLDRTPLGAEREISLNSLGVLATCLRVQNLVSLRYYLLQEGVEVSKIIQSHNGDKRCFARDCNFNWLCLIEISDGWFLPPKKNKDLGYSGGVVGVIIGVKDMDTSIEFYKNICGYDKKIYDKEDRFKEFEIFSQSQKVRRVLLKSTRHHQGLFSHLLGSSFIELIEAKEEKGDPFFKDRYWGDLGFIHLCFDIRGMDDFKTHCENFSCPFTIDTGQEFSMENASGRFAYLEDPDGTLIEFVEVYKIPIAKKFGVVLNVHKKPLGYTLPKYLLKSLRFMS